MSGKIYVVDGADTLHALEERRYDSEDLLQTLIERYPDLLAGEQMNTESPRRWILVKRETGVPGEEGGNNRWSLDHLFLDQDGVPTLVEVKRGTDTRIRREVVGQMLDYAANAVVYWSLDKIIVEHEATCAAFDIDPAEQVAELLEAPPDDGEVWEAYWQRVKTNLQAGRIRLVFVADEVPPELRRIVEFLNGQMDPAEILAVEVRQYVADGLRTLVPRVIGQTLQAERKKASAPTERRQWDEPSFMSHIEEACGTTERRLAQRILEWGCSHNLRIWWGRGNTDGSFYPVYDHGKDQHPLLAVWNRTGAVGLQFKTMRPPFNTMERKEELLRKIQAIPGIKLTHTDVTKYPGFSLSDLAEGDRVEQFLSVFDWMLKEIKAHYGEADSDEPRVDNPVR